MPRAKKLSPGEAAVQELQDKPAEVARAEAEHAADALPKKRGRPKGSKNKPQRAAKRRGRPAKNTIGSGLDEINAVVESMVEHRTREVLQIALAALKQAAAAVERAL